MRADGLTDVRRVIDNECGSDTVISQAELTSILTLSNVNHASQIVDAFCNQSSRPLTLTAFLDWLQIDGRDNVNGTDLEPVERQVSRQSRSSQQSRQPQLARRMSKLAFATEGYMEGSLQDNPASARSVQEARRVSKAKISDARISFGTHKFRGAEAAPWLGKFGLNCDVLDDAEWTVNHADAVAAAVAAWAMERGATMICHWSQPLRSANGTWRGSAPTRMVHALFNPGPDGKPICILDGSYLIGGEGDSRKMIDISSPMWVQSDVLFIPSILVNYNNSSFIAKDFVLCEKTPLLRAMHAVSLAGVRLLGLLGHTCNDVVPKIGLEQEFFLVPRAAYDTRWDLQRCGRTLFGSLPHGSDLYDTHSTPLNEVAQACMADIQGECFKLGIQLRTRHRESAPNQYEFAPHFGVAPAQVDENLVTMEIIEGVARKHGLVALLHEKPFAGVNGSGKHNNFSLGTDTGLNLFNEKHASSITSGTCGPHEAFPVIMAAVCRAVFNHGNLLMASVSCPGNDFRLTKTGGNEAPPTCVSAHLGESLTQYLTAFANSTDASSESFSVKKEKVLLGIPAVDLHGIEISAEPRNRSSPLPYAGRRFELRSSGSSQNVSMVNVVLCSMIAESFNCFSDAIESGATPREVAAKALKEEGGLKAVYNDNNYVEEWRAEAEKRGLVSVDSIVDGICQFSQDKTIALFESLNVLSRKELEERVDTLLENYVITVEIEARCMLDMIKRQIIPVARAAGLKEAPEELLGRLAQSTSSLQKEVSDLYEIDDFEDQARKAREVRLTAMTEIRMLCNEIEELVPVSAWPMASYQELLFDDMNYCKPLC